MLAGEPGAGAITLEVELSDGKKIIAKGVQVAKISGISDPDASLNPVTSAPVHAGPETVTDVGRNIVSLDKLGAIKLWDLQQPTLYTVHVRLLRDGKEIDNDSRRIGFREARLLRVDFRLMERL